jgi:rhodanese-related sulfurtransferase
MLWCLLGLLACGSPTPTDAEALPPGVQPAERGDIDVDGLAAVLPDGVPVLDVRTPGEFAGGHVPGAVSLPMGFSVDDPALASLDRSEPVYVICQSGGRSSRAADQLARAGYRAVNVTGGTAAWIAAGHEVER